MKKLFMSLGLAGLMLLGACGNKNVETADTDTIVEQTVTVITETPVSVSSAAELQQALEENNWKINDKGDIVTPDGTVVMTFGDAAQAYGAYYKEAMENSGKSFTEAVKSAGSEVGAAAEAAVERTKEKAADAVEAAKDKASDAVQSAKDKASEAARSADKAAQDAKAKAAQATRDAKEKAGKAAENAGKAVNDFVNR